MARDRLTAEGSGGRLVVSTSYHDHSQTYTGGGFNEGYSDPESTDGLSDGSWMGIELEAEGRSSAAAEFSTGPSGISAEVGVSSTSGSRSDVNVANVGSSLLASSNLHAKMVSPDAEWAGRDR